MEEGSGDFEPLYVDLYKKLNRANEIVEHIIRVDFATRARSLYTAFIPLTEQARTFRR